MRTGFVGAVPCPQRVWTPEWKDGDGRRWDTLPDDGAVVGVRSVEAVPALVMDTSER